MCQAADSTENSTAYEGTVTDLQVEQAPSKVVVRFLLGLDDGTPLPVEMRGEELRGILSNGHRVAVPSPSSGGTSDDATLHATRIKNLTTGGIVELWRAGLARRSTRALAPGEVRSAVISAAVGGSIAVAFSALHSGGGRSSGTSSTPTGSGGFDWELLIAVLVGALAVLALFLWYFWARKRRGGRALLGFSVGLLAFGIPLIVLR